MGDITIKIDILAGAIIDDVAADCPNERLVMQILYTDCPFTELGDEDGKEAPIRNVMPLSYDNDKYVKVLVDGIYSEIKAGYIYTERGRYGEVPTFNPAEYFSA